MSVSGPVPPVVVVQVPKELLPAMFAATVAGHTHRCDHQHKRTYDNPHP